MMTEPLSPIDHFWHYIDDPANPMITNGMLEFNDPPDFDHLYAVVERQLLYFKRFKQRIVLPLSHNKNPFWEMERNFDLRSHLHRIALPAPGDKAMLQEIISDLISTPLDATKPLWKIYLIENFKNRCVLLFRIHHCITVDSDTLLHILFSITDTKPDAILPDPLIKEADQISPDLFFRFPFEKVAKKVKQAVRFTREIGTAAVQELSKTISNPFYLIELTKKRMIFTTKAAAVLTKLAMMPNHPPNSFKGEIGGRQSVAWTLPIPLDSMKTDNHKISPDALIIATITGLLRRYLKKRDENVNELDLVAAVPIKTGLSPSTYQVGDSNMVFLSLPVHIEDPVLRLREVIQRLDKLKQSPDIFLGFWFLNALGMSPAKIAKKAGCIFGNKVSAVLIQISGPGEPLYLAGKKITNINFWTSRVGNVGLGISIFSYDNKVTIGLTCDTKQVSDPVAVLEGFEENLNLLLGIF